MHRATHGRLRKSSRCRRCHARTARPADRNICNRGQAKEIRFQMMAVCNALGRAWPMQSQGAHFGQPPPTYTRLGRGLLLFGVLESSPHCLFDKLASWTSLNLSSWSHGLSWPSAPHRYPRAGTTQMQRHRAQHLEGASGHQRSSMLSPARFEMAQRRNRSIWP